MTRSDNASDSQKLSQLMDGEWLEINPSESVAKLCADPALRGKWERYHLIRDALNNEPVQVTRGLAERVSAALEDEPAYSNITPFSHSAQSALAADRQGQTQQPSAESESGPSSESGIDSARQSRLSTGRHQDGGDAAGDRKFADSAESADNEALVGLSSDTVSRAAANAPASDGQRVAAGHRSVFRTGMTGLALAASAAFATVIGVDYLQGNAGVPAVPTTGSIAQAVPGSSDIAQPLSVDEAGNAPAFASAESATSVGEVLIDVPDADVFSRQLELDYVSHSGDGAFWMSPVSAERVQDADRQNYLLLRHLEHSPASTREGLLPFSRLVGYDEAQPGR